jgi:hypothetical protein
MPTRPHACDPVPHEDARGRRPRLPQAIR